MKKSKNQQKSFYERINALYKYVLKKSNIWLWLTPVLCICLTICFWLFASTNPQTVQRFLSTIIDLDAVSVVSRHLILISVGFLFFAASFYTYIDYHQHLAPYKHESIAHLYHPLHHARLVVLPRMKYNWWRGVWSLACGVVGLLLVSLVLAFTINPRVVRAYASNDFVTTWKTDNPGSTADNQISIPLDYTDSVTIDWGDGNITVENTLSNPIHTYSTPGIYTVIVTGNIKRICTGCGSYGDSQKLLSVEQWGSSQWETMESAFRSASNLQINATDAPDLSGVSSLRMMFNEASAFNSNINHWDVSNITDMSNMFREASSFNQPLNDWNTSSLVDAFWIFLDATSFNQPLNNWDVSNITDMSSMFRGAEAFNQSLNGWNVSNVTNMRGMFLEASSFNGAIDAWDVSGVTDMSIMFSNATSFNQPLNNWDVSNVTSFEQMFYNATNFNQPLNSWNVSNVTSMNSMFSYATSFNSAIDPWDVSSVTDFIGMFAGATSFNQPLNNWDTSSVTSFEQMFVRATSFNQPLNSWNTSNVINMLGMFGGASSFNQPLNNWNTGSVTNMFAMFAGASDFDQSLANWNVSNVTNMTQIFGNFMGFFPYTSGLSLENYEATLAGWSSQSLQNGVIFNGGSSTYCEGSGIRQMIIDTFNWTITDSGENCETVSQLQIITTSLPALTKNEYSSVYIYTVDAQDADAEFSIDTGALPNGLQLVDLGDYARIIGTPTESGIFNFTLRAQDSNSHDIQTYSLEVKSSTATTTQNNNSKVVSPNAPLRSNVSSQGNVQAEAGGGSDLESSSKSKNSLILSTTSPSFFEQIIKNISKRLGVAPELLVVALPWSLIALLFILATVMTLKAVWQLILAHKTKKLIETQVVLNHEKRSLLSLSGHYLRTPLTILSAGVEILPKEGDTRQNISEASNKLQKTINSLIESVENNQDLAQLTEPEPHIIEEVKLIQKAAIVPTIIVFGIVISINLVLKYYTSFSSDWLNSASQIVCTIFAGVLLFSMHRFWMQRRNLTKYKERLLAYEEALDSARNKFMKGVFKELTPAVIAVDSEISSDLPDNTATYFKEGLRQLEHTIENFILISQLEQKKLQQKASTVVLRDTVNALKEQIDSSEVISQKIPQNIVVKQPEFLLRKVLRSLVDNGLRHSDHQSVQISARRKRHLALVDIVDQGEGIPKEKLSILFKPLSRVEEAEDFTHDGIGLSLYVDRLVMHYLGGEISARSQLGKGTTMRLAIPNKLS